MPSTLVALSSRSAPISLARSGGVGGEKRIARAGAEDDDAALVEVVDGGAPEKVSAMAGMAMALIARASTPLRERVAWIASALIMVASMPM